MNVTHYPDPDWYNPEYVAAMTDLFADDLRAPGTDDEPWTVPEQAAEWIAAWRRFEASRDRHNVVVGRPLYPDPPAARRSLALAVLIVALVVVAIVWRR